MASLKSDGSAFDEWTENHAWLLAHYRRLACGYDQQNVAVYKRKVVDHDKSLVRLLVRVKRSFPENKVAVDYISRKKRELIL